MAYDAADKYIAWHGKDKKRRAIQSPILAILCCFGFARGIEKWTPLSDITFGQMSTLIILFLIAISTIMRRGEEMLRSPVLGLVLLFLFALGVEDWHHRPDAGYIELLIPSVLLFIALRNIISWKFKRIQG